MAIAFIAYQNFACSMCACMCVPNMDGLTPLADPNATTVSTTMVCNRGGCGNEGIHVAVNLNIVQCEPVS